MLGLYCQFSEPIFCDFKSKHVPMHSVTKTTTNTSINMVIQNLMELILKLGLVPGKFSSQKGSLSLIQTLELLLHSMLTSYS